MSRIGEIIYDAAFKLTQQEMEMGQIVVTTLGSFPNAQTHRDTATEGGHAAAIGRTIQYLTALLPDAIAKDHELHDEGTMPPDADFGRCK